VNEKSDLTDDQAGAIFLGGLCCCFMGVVGLVVLIIVLTRKKPQPQAAPVAQAAYSQTQQPYAPPAGPYTPQSYAPSPASPYAPQPGASATPAGAQPVAPPQPGAPHLLVLAVGLDLAAREAVAAQLAAPISASSPFEMRVQLVQRMANVLLQAEAAWRYFGYGEKGLPDLASAEQSYRANVDDFRLRSNIATEPFGTIAVLTVVLATRTPLHAVTRLDDVGQLRLALQSWQRLDSSLLLGAEYLWAPQSGAISDDAMGRRFPEMQRLLRL